MSHVSENSRSGTFDRAVKISGQIAKIAAGLGSALVSAALVFISFNGYRISENVREASTNVKEASKNFSEASANIRDGSNNLREISTAVINKAGASGEIAANLAKASDNFAIASNNVRKSTLLVNNASENLGRKIDKASQDFNRKHEPDVAQSGRSGVATFPVSSSAPSPAASQ